MGAIGACTVVVRSDAFVAVTEPEQVSYQPTYCDGFGVVGSEKTLPVVEDAFK
jgi:hypothetical protein